MMTIVPIPVPISTHSNSNRHTEVFDKFVFIGIAIGTLIFFIYGQLYLQNDLAKTAIPLFGAIIGLTVGCIIGFIGEMLCDEKIYKEKQLHIDSTLVISEIFGIILYLWWLVK